MAQSGEIELLDPAVRAPAARLLNEHVAKMLRMRLVGGRGVISSRRVPGGTTLELANAGGSHGTVPNAANALAGKFRPGCVPLKLAAAVARIASTLPALGGPGILVYSESNGRRIEAHLEQCGGTGALALETGKLFKSIDAFIEDWNTMIGWVNSIQPIAGHHITLWVLNDRTVVEAAQLGGGCGECDACEECDPCDPCDAVCDPCDPCDITCDPCEACDVSCDPCQSCDGGCDPCQPCDPCDNCDPEW